MATGLVNIPVVEDISSSMTPTSQLNTTGTDPTVFKAYRFGNVVFIHGYLNLKSTASGTYTDVDVFTGAPPAPSSEENYPVGGMFFPDGTSMAGAMMGVYDDGGIHILVRGIAVASKKGPFFLTYITN